MMPERCPLEETDSRFYYTLLTLFIEPFRIALPKRRILLIDQNMPSKSL